MLFFSPSVVFIILIFLVQFLTTICYNISLFYVEMLNAMKCMKGAIYYIWFIIIRGQALKFFSSSSSSTCTWDSMAAHQTFFMKFGTMVKSQRPSQQFWRMSFKHCSTTNRAKLDIRLQK